jgi:outer membrane lipoprotein carrier protein
VRRLGGLLLVGFWSIAGFAADVAAPNATHSLQRFFSEVRSYSAGFQQTVLDESKAVLQESKGRLWLERPGKFRWNYETPYKQQIVSDGERVWIYDEDLQQVTVKPVDRALLDTPAMLLSGKGRVEDHFTVKDAGADQGIAWAQLLPKRKDSGFEEVRLGFEQGKLKVFLLRDGFGQTTRYTLRNPQENVLIEPSRFSFTPPKGADIVGQ